METPQHFVPRLPVGPFEPFGSFSIADDLFGFRVPADLPAGARVLADAQIPAVVAGDTLSVELPPDQAERVTRVLAAKDLYVSELRPQEVDLETVFLELTKDEGLGP